MMIDVDECMKREDDLARCQTSSTTVAVLMMSMILAVHPLLV